MDSRAYASLTPGMETAEELDACTLLVNSQVCVYCCCTSQRHHFGCVTRSNFTCTWFTGCNQVCVLCMCVANHCEKVTSSSTCDMPDIPKQQIKFSSWLGRGVFVLVAVVLRWLLLTSVLIMQGKELLSPGKNATYNDEHKITTPMQVSLHGCRVCCSAAVQCIVCCTLFYVLC